MARQRRLAASNSWVPDEVRLMDEILTRMRVRHRGGQDPLVRHPAYVTLCRKVQSMKRALRRVEQQRKLAKAQAESSEGDPISRIEGHGEDSKTD